MGGVEDGKSDKLMAGWVVMMARGRKEAGGRKRGEPMAGRAIGGRRKREAHKKTTEEEEEEKMKERVWEAKEGAGMRGDGGCWDLETEGEGDDGNDSDRMERGQKDGDGARDGGMFQGEPERGVGEGEEGGGGGGLTPGRPCSTCSPRPVAMTTSMAAAVTALFLPPPTCSPLSGSVPSLFFSSCHLRRSSHSHRRLFPDSSFFILLLSFPPSSLSFLYFFFSFPNNPPPPSLLHLFFRNWLKE